IDRMEIEKGPGKSTVGDVHEHVHWHVRRASAMGGSDSGTIVKHFRGKRGGFSDARSIVMQKLLIMSPMPGTPEMSRGVRAEPWIQQMYQEQTGAKTIDADLKKLRGFRWAGLPSMIGTPDDFVSIVVDDIAGKTNREARRRMIDYKCPSAAVVEDYESNGVSFDYVCQLHHYGILTLAAGAKFDDMAIECFDPRHFDIKSFPVPFDKELAREMSAAHQKIWNEFVMAGVLPEKLQADELELEDDEIVNLGVKLTAVKVLSKDLEDRAKELQKTISTLGGDWHGLAEGSLKMEVASFDRTRQWNQTELLAMATAAGLDTDDYAKADKAIDPDKVAALMQALKDNEGDGGGLADVAALYLEEGAIKKTKYDLKKMAEDLEDMGVNTISAAELSERFTMTRKKKGPEVDRLNILKDQASVLADGIENAIEETVPSIRAMIMPADDVEEEYPELDV
ncbi:MAG: YqaJ viral recombinase family protein, partial [Roseibium sp.]|uniref:YqaJ viral recombinase family protein n=1 Tax=Roseibium sp. TaxID=1936156 RepID=UPI0032994CC3